jgi:hypothetical protein
MRLLFSPVCFLFFFFTSNGQVMINEASNSNYTQIADSENDYPDWIELYNAGAAQTMQGYYLSDSKDNLMKWAFPNMRIVENDWALLFASGKYEDDNAINHWETAVRDNDIWKWINPDAATPSSWQGILFDDSNWPSGQGGFGFSDDDDGTTFDNTSISVYARIKINIPDTSVISAAVLHMDYDDGFIAYLNGQEIARSNVSGVAQWNTPADNSHEAVMYQGQNPEEFRLDMEYVKQFLTEGNNVLAIHAMNQSLTSSDISARAFLSFGIETSSQFFNPPPDWFNLMAASGSHINFKLDGRGETIYLSNSNGVILDSLAVPKLPLNASYGRARDGDATLGIFTIATPGESNNTQSAFTNGVEAAPGLDKESGFYPTTILVSVTTPLSSSQVRYTVDGQTPSLSSPLYTTAIPITVNTVLKARSFSAEGKLPSETTTSTYFIGDASTQAGILSITTDNENLYGETGIYDNWWTDWKKPCYIEYFAPTTHELAFKQRAGLKIDGGAGGSRSQPQRSFRVEPGNGVLGDGSLHYKLLPARPLRDQYETFYLRNGSNQYLYYPCKDAIETRCLAYGTNTPYSEYAPVQVYLNGQYWGFYELREKQDEDYFEQNYGIDRDSLELLGVSYYYGGVLRSIEGKKAVENFNNDYTAFQNLPVADSLFWDKADRYFDLDAYIDYICMQSWIANTDWPYNNIKIFRGPQTKKRWRFGVIDVELSLQPQGWTDSNFDHIRFMKDYALGYPYLDLWQKGMQNEKFKNNFINRFADLMNSNWLPDTIRAIANARYEETRPEMPKNFERWGDSNNVAGHMSAFDDAHQIMLSELSNRSVQVRNHILSNFNLAKQVAITLDVVPRGAGKIKISTMKPTEYPWTGIYFDGVPVTIEAIANPGYRFVKWNDSPFISSIGNKIFQSVITSTSAFSATFEFNGLSNQVTISEINYNSTSELDTEDWFEIWNYAESSVADLTDWYFTDQESTNRFTFPATTTINANTGIIVAHDCAKFNSFHPTVSCIGNFDFKLGNAGDAIRLYDNNDNLVVEVVYDDKLPWPTQADGTGKTLELCSLGEVISEASQWFSGKFGGSPGEAFLSDCLTTGVSDEAVVPKSLVYPNPTTGKFKLASPTSAVSVAITDPRGRVVETFVLLQREQEFDVGLYVPGVYYLKIVFDDGQQRVLKLIKY